MRLAIANVPSVCPFLQVAYVICSSCPDHAHVLVPLILVDSRSLNLMLVKLRAYCHLPSVCYAQAGFPVFATFLEANHVRTKSDANSLDSLTEDAIQAVQRLARDPHIGERIIDSIAPSIYGHRDIKACIALALFGGQEKHVGSHRLRWALIDVLKSESVHVSEFVSLTVWLPVTASWRAALILHMNGGCPLIVVTLYVSYTQRLVLAGGTSMCCS